MKTVVVLLSKTFFPQHPKAGQETHFKEKVICGQCGCKLIDECVECGDWLGVYELLKIHTCRLNYEYWKKRIDRLKAEGGALSIRQWSGKPYRSKQEVIVNIPSENVEVQKLTLCINKGTDFYVEGKITPIHSITEWEATVNGNNIHVANLAANDGLNVEDYKAWFAPVFEKKQTNTLDFAIIHFTKFRYRAEDSIFKQLK
jgi:hypothetical protein